MKKKTSHLKISHIKTEDQMESDKTNSIEKISEDLKEIAALIEAEMQSDKDKNIDISKD